MPEGIKEITERQAAMGDALALGAKKDVTSCEKDCGEWQNTP